MSFPRHEGIFRSDGLGLGRSGAQSERLHAPTHRLDEFPTGYSSAGWSPPEPVSASPAEQKFTMKAAPQPSLFQRMGKPCLTGCLTAGVHRNFPFRPLAVQATPSIALNATLISFNTSPLDPLPMAGLRRRPLHDALSATREDIPVVLQDRRRGKGSCERRPDRANRTSEPIDYNGPSEDRPTCNPAR